MQRLFLFFFVFVSLVGSSVVASPAEKAERANFRVAFTESIRDREPVGELETADAAKLSRLFFFSEIIDRNGETITHVWKNGDDEIYSHAFDISGARWRVFSSVSMKHYKPGDMAVVQIQDTDGHVLQVNSIEIK